MGSGCPSFAFVGRAFSQGSGEAEAAGTGPVFFFTEGGGGGCGVCWDTLLFEAGSPRSRVGSLRFSPICGCHSKCI